MTDLPPGPLDLPRAVQLDAGGDAACWMASVCPACGAFTEPPAPCWNCGRSAGPDPFPPANR